MDALRCLCVFPRRKAGGREGRPRQVLEISSAIIIALANEIGGARDPSSFFANRFAFKTFTAQ